MCPSSQVDVVQLLQTQTRATRGEGGSGGEVAPELVALVGHPFFSCRTDTPTGCSTELDLCVVGKDTWNRQPKSGEDGPKGTRQVLDRTWPFDWLKDRVEARAAWITKNKYTCYHGGKGKGSKSTVQLPNSNLCTYFLVSIDNSNGREGLAPVPDPPRVRGVRMKKLARAKAKDRQASSSVTGSLQDVDSSQDDDSTTSAQMRTCGQHNPNPHLVHYSDRSELRRICVVCGKRQHFYCPSCNSFMCLGPCFVKHHST